MSFTFYDAYVPLVQRAILSVRDTLQKAETSPDSESFLKERLYEDMLPLSSQIFIVAFMACKMASDLTGEEAAALDQNVPTFEAAYKLLDQVRDVLAKVDRDVVNKRQDEPALVKTMTGESFPMETVKDIVIGWDIPHLMFHVTTAYGILRSRGVPLSKTDYLGAFMAPFRDVRAKN